jgi:hypothetical protein
MKTKGVEVWMGYLAIGFRRGNDEWTPAGGFVPDAFWARMKHEVMRQGCVDEFKAEEAEAKAQATRDGESERRLFRVWYARLGFPRMPGEYEAQLWPWSRGWTEDRVDLYLTNALREVA